VLSTDVVIVLSATRMNNRSHSTILNELTESIDSHRTEGLFTNLAAMATASSLVARVLGPKQTPRYQHLSLQQLATMLNNAVDTPTVMLAITGLLRICAGTLDREGYYDLARRTKSIVAVLANELK